MTFRATVVLKDYMNVNATVKASGEFCIMLIIIIRLVVLDSPPRAYSGGSLMNSIDRVALIRRHLMGLLDRKYF